MKSIVALHALVFLAGCAPPASQMPASAAADPAADLLKDRYEAMDFMNIVRLGDVSNSAPEFWLVGKNTVRYTIGSDVMIADSYDGKAGKRLWKLPLVESGGTGTSKGTLRRFLAREGKAPGGNWPPEARAALDTIAAYAVYKFTIGAGGMQGWVINPDGESTPREDIPDKNSVVQYAITKAERNLLGWK